jgi:hypothetical protein
MGTETKSTQAVSWDIKGCTLNVKESGTHSYHCASNS